VTETAVSGPLNIFSHHHHGLALLSVTRSFADRVTAWSAPFSASEFPELLCRIVALALVQLRDAFRARLVPMDPGEGARRIAPRLPTDSGAHSAVATPFVVFVGHCGT
jgi:hypothetical protein